MHPDWLETAPEGVCINSAETASKEMLSLQPYDQGIRDYEHSLASPRHEQCIRTGWKQHQKESVSTDSTETVSKEMLSLRPFHQPAVSFMWKLGLFNFKQ